MRSVGSYNTDHKQDWTGHMNYGKVKLVQIKFDRRCFPEKHQVAYPQQAKIYQQGFYFNNEWIEQ